MSAPLVLVHVCCVCLMVVCACLVTPPRASICQRQRYYSFCVPTLLFCLVGVVVLCMRTSAAPFDRSSVRSLVIRTCGEWVRVLYAVFAGICCVARDIGCLEIRDSSRFLRAFFFILACFMSCIEVPEPLIEVCFFPSVVCMLLVIFCHGVLKLCWNETLCARIRTYIHTCICLLVFTDTYHTCLARWYGGDWLVGNE